MQDGKEAKKNEAIHKKRRISGDWTKHGKFMVKTTFGDKSVTDLMILYAERVASLRY
jgi:hypothetical protein